MSFRILFFVVTIFLFLAGTSSVYADVLNVVPNAKHANDNTGEAVSEITSDDSSVNPDTLSSVVAGDGAYTVDKGIIIYFTTFDVSAIPSGSTITGAILHLQYGAEDGYSGTNLVRYDNGSGLTSTGITPTDITGFSADLTFNLFSAGVDTISEIQNLDIEFTNNDGAGPDAIHFDYLWITVTYTPPAAPDTTAPAAVANLALSGATNNSINVSWTAPGDDGSIGTATSYDLRYSTAAITAGNFSSATQVTGEPAPSVAGSAESMTVSGLSPNTLYYFAIKTSDEVPNTSAISNVPSLSTTAAPDTTPPAAIIDLGASNPSNSAITLTWTSPGDDAGSGTAASYDIRHSTSNITEGNWSSATLVSGEPAPLIADTSQSMTVSGLSASTLYYFAMKTSDEVPNTSAISNMVSLSTTATLDTTAPAAIANLSLSEATVSSIKLTWTSPGDDASSGTAASYDIRYSTSNITDTNWSGATPVSDEPAPQVVGTSQSMTVTGLSASTLYYFAIKTSDEAPNTSAISNVPSLMTTEVESALFIAPTLTPVSIPRPEWEEFAPKRVMFSGSSYPLSRVELLRKESLESGFQSLFDIKTTILSDGTFKILLGGLARGEQFLGIRAQDPQGRRSNVLSFAVTLLALDNYEVKDILLPPTVEMKSKIIRQDEQIELVGYAGRSSAIEVAIDDNLQLQRETVAAASGVYSFSTNASSFSPGIHYLSVRQRLVSGIASLFSAPISFKISSLSSPKADFNNDDKVNITDWSIFLYRWASQDQELRKSVDLDQNSEINIIDFSIFLKSLTM